MPRARVELNSSGMAELLSSAGVRADVQRRARIVEGVARQIAPTDTGAYREGITSWVEQHRDRVVVKVGSTDRKAVVIEASTGTMARAIRAAGVGQVRR